MFKGGERKGLIFRCRRNQLSGCFVEAFIHPGAGESVKLIWIFAFCGIASYLLGSVPSGYLIARLRGIDVRHTGSRNIGATNVFRSVGKGWGLLTFLCDALKGFTAAFFVPLMAEFLVSPEIDPALPMLCACFAVAGHNWPVYLCFKGGKGVATSAGALLGIAPGAMAIGLFTWIAVFLLTRYVSVASMLTAAVISISAWILHREGTVLLPVTVSILGAVAIWRHRTNIERLIKGTENKFEFTKKNNP